MEHYYKNKTLMLDSLSILWEIFSSITINSLCRGIYIVLDALDECREYSRNLLFGKLNSHFGSSSNKTLDLFLKVLMTSRPYKEVAKLLIELVCRLKTEEEEEKINAGIWSYILHKVERLSKDCY
jgi:hypothetical protein